MVDTIMTVLVFSSTFLTLAIWSFFYRENWIYNVAENLGVGIYVGNSLIVGLDTINRMGIQPFLKGTDYTLIIPLILGPLVLVRLRRKLAWISSFPMAIIYGVSAGLMMRNLPKIDIIDMIASVSSDFGSLNPSLMLMSIVTITTLLYFTYTFKGPVGTAITTVGKLGRYFFMIAIGAQLAVSSQQRVGRIVSTEIQIFVLEEAKFASYSAVTLILAWIFIEAFYRRYKKLHAAELKAMV